MELVNIMYLRENMILLVSYFSFTSDFLSLKADTWLLTIFLPNFSTANFSADSFW